jgi:uncharacterized protein YndB with AHSA1/START domain
MTKRSVTHATLAIERNYPASPAKVFAAFADPQAKAKWFVGPDEWQGSDHSLDFRVGGREHVSGGPKGGPVHVFDATYQDIVAGERIIYTYDMHLDGQRISVSVATIELKAAGEGTQLKLTEQGAFLDGFDIPDDRERGTRDLLDNRGKALARQAAN